MIPGNLGTAIDSRFMFFGPPAPIVATDALEQGEN
jgi:hypothetical protein